MDDLLFAVQVMILGFSTVLMTLLALYLLFLLFGRLLGPSREYTRETKVSPTLKPLGEDVPAEKVAAITAAVYAYLSHTYGKERTFKIMHVSRSEKTAGENAWSLEGRKELLNQYEELERVKEGEVWKKNLLR